jgi:DNA-binding transcriptional LysR family regulator
MAVLASLGLLRHFLAVAEDGNLTAAARRLGLSQPALTKIIRRLEDQLGASLFERRSRGMALTAYGEIMLRPARGIASECRFAEAELEAVRRGYKGQLRIGAGPFWGSAIVPRAVARLHERFPDLQVELLTGVNTITHPKLLRGDLDLVVSALPPDEPLPPSMARHELMTIEMRLIAGSTHPLWAKPVIEAPDLDPYRWIIYQEDREVLAQLLPALRAAGGAPPRFAVEASSLFAVVHLLEAGRYLACLAEPLVRALPASGIGILPYSRPIWSFPAGMLVRRSLQATLPVQVFQELLRAEVSRVADLPRGLPAGSPGPV